MFCQNCGSTLSAGARFCPNCGQGVTTQASAPGPRIVGDAGLPMPSVKPPSPGEFTPEATEQFEPMPLKSMLFSTAGRLGRARFLACYLSLTILYIAFILLIAVLFPQAQTQDALGVATLVFIWPNICIWAKRLQDCNYPAFTLLLLFIPIVGLAVIAYAFLIRGTKGPNKYGPASNVLPPRPSESTSAWS